MSKQEHCDKIADAARDMGKFVTIVGGHILHTRQLIMITQILSAGKITGDELRVSMANAEKDENRLEGVGHEFVVVDDVTTSQIPPGTHYGRIELINQYEEVLTDMVRRKAYEQTIVLDEAHFARDIRHNSLGFLDCGNRKERRAMRSRSGQTKEGHNRPERSQMLIKGRGRNR